MTNPIIGRKEPTPLYDLFAKFPDVPRTTIIKQDILNWGVRYTPILNWIGRWTLPLGSFGYSTFPDEVKSGEVSRSPQEANLFDIPSFMLLRDGTNIQMLIKPDAPYEIRYEGDGSYVLYWNEMAVEEVLYISRPNRLSNTLKDGTPVPLVLTPMSDTHT